MNEIVFLVEEAKEGGYTARALGESIYTEADNMQQLHTAILDALHCHFDNHNTNMCHEFKSRSSNQSP